MFCRNMFKKFQKNRAPNNVTLIDFLDDTSKYLKGEIIIGHRKGHDCIIYFLILMVFMIFTQDSYLKIFIADKKRKFNLTWAVVILKKKIENQGCRSDR